MAYVKTIWENLPSESTPINASNLNKMENGIYDNSVAIETINASINNIKGTVLWTNPSPTSTFAEQTITLSSNDFDIYEIFYYVATSNEQIMTTKSLKGHGTRIVIPTGNFEYRTVVSNSDTSYTINSISNNENGVPIYVIGYKTGLFNV